MKNRFFLLFTLTPAVVFATLYSMPQAHAVLPNEHFIAVYEDGRRLDQPFFVFDSLCDTDNGVCKVGANAVGIVVTKIRPEIDLGEFQRAIEKDGFENTLCESDDTGKWNIEDGSCSPFYKAKNRDMDNVEYDELVLMHQYYKLAVIARSQEVSRYFPIPSEKEVGSERWVEKLIKVDLATGEVRAYPLEEKYLNGDINYKVKIGILSLISLLTIVLVVRVYGKKYWYTNKKRH